MWASASAASQRVSGTGLRDRDPLGGEVTAEEDGDEVEITVGDNAEDGDATAEEYGHAVEGTSGDNAEEGGDVTAEDGDTIEVKVGNAISETGQAVEIIFDNPAQEDGSAIAEVLLPNDPAAAEADDNATAEAFLSNGTVEEEDADTVELEPPAAPARAGALPGGHFVSGASSSSHSSSSSPALLSSSGPSAKPQRSLARSSGRPQRSGRTIEPKWLREVRVVGIRRDIE